MNKIIYLLLFILINSSLMAEDGKKVFETYCWGCHHQTAVAFGPPFEEIAAKRNVEEIRAMITSPQEVSKILGYARNAMPAFQLSDENLTAITTYITSYKPVKVEENKTIIQNPYPNIAKIEEKK
ncbi:cytochrome c [bacterium]|nr:cytochrome c [bacterium]MBU1957612.1 cytochrome c [bacterium]